jgi:hypothetical protein|tara:strand:- start:3080 stop:3415 length:336 start_codon:yes stop_codon:yes gene_type:complete
MKAIDRAVSHFDSQEIRSLTVEEWSDESGTLVIYAKPLTLQESSKLYRLSKNDDLALLAYAIINKSLDENGDKMFTMDDKIKLMNNVDVGVLTKIGTWIMGTEDLETVEKK